VLLYSPGLSTCRSLIGTSGGQCGQLKHRSKAGDDRMEKLLLTVWEAADVLSVSRSRVLAPRRAARLGEDRSVSAGGTSFGAALGGQSIGVMNSRRPQDEGPDVLPRLRVDRRTARPDHLHTDAPSSRRGTAMARSIGPRSKLRPLLWTVWQRGTTHLLRRLPATRPHPMTSQNQPQDRQSRVSAANPQDTSAASALDGRTEGPTLCIGEAVPLATDHQEGRRS